MVRTLQQVGDRREFISVPDLKDARTIMLEATKVLVQHKTTASQMLWSL